ncbi:KpsF/GutQ family sugar-phosphate isomerase [Haloferax chudinovii]|uniref:SIS domain-containing protein n=1 Tax=Haloferax chudinovii TaxID=1109010 RepID=A0ABD5XK40_9EURY
MSKSKTEMERLVVETLRTQSTALTKLADSDSLSDIVGAANVIHDSGGRVIVTGIGKSGDISKKITSTLTSIGQPSFFIHPVEAQHGDLAVISEDDVVILISNSGNTSEVVDLAYFANSFEATTIAITSDPESELGQLADVHIDTKVDEEGAFVDLVPMTSTTVTMAIGDAIANIVMCLSNFDEEQFANFHPGGTIGKRLLLTVEDVMSDDIDSVSESHSLVETIYKMSEGGKGIAVITDKNGGVEGVITDGDLRRLIETGFDFHDTTAGEVMTSDPISVSPSDSVVTALQLLEDRSITQLVVERDGKFDGILHIHDLMSEGIK